MPSKYRRIGLFAAAISLVCLAGCSSERATNPLRTATEQLLISTAADRAASELMPGVPVGTKVFLDTKYFQGYDSGYAIGAIRDQLLRKGVALVDNEAHADAVISVRAGALSTDDHSTLIGIPQLQFPFLPVGNLISVPEIALFKTSEAKGVAKFAMTGYDAKTGKLISSDEPQYGFSHQTNHTIFLFFSWRSGDVLPPGADENDLSLKTLSSMWLDHEVVSSDWKPEEPAPMQARAEVTGSTKAATRRTKSTVKRKIGDTDSAKPVDAKPDS